MSDVRAPRPKPEWDTPARIDGLPAKNWKTREGVPLADTLADCITRWLSLPSHHQRDCTLGWGPPDGVHGLMEASSIAAYVLSNGLPPMMAAERGGQLIEGCLSEPLVYRGSLQRRKICIVSQQCWSKRFALPSD